MTIKAGYISRVERLGKRSDLSTMLNTFKLVFIFLSHYKPLFFYK
nr:MAG TPA: hypothetical protein [Caudoviricetes sp.]